MLIDKQAHASGGSFPSDVLDRVALRLLPEPIELFANADFVAGDRALLASDKDRFYKI